MRLLEQECVDFRAEIDTNTATASLEREFDHNFAFKAVTHAATNCATLRTKKELSFFLSLHLCVQ